ncbi:MAG: hypothetical protein ACOY4L_00060 [Pseudomonadota bacterium]
MNQLLEALGIGPGSLVLLHNFLQQHGYRCFFLGTLAEGEAILVLAGSLAHAGHLELIKGILTAWVARRPDVTVARWRSEPGPKAFGPPFIPTSICAPTPAENISLADLVNPANADTLVHRIITANIGDRR